MGPAPPACPRPHGSASSATGAAGLTIGRATAYAAAGALLVLTMWAAATVWYLVNHDTLAGIS